MKKELLDEFIKLGTRISLELDELAIRTTEIEYKTYGIDSIRFSDISGNDEICISENDRDKENKVEEINKRIDELIIKANKRVNTDVPLLETYKQLINWVNKNSERHKELINHVYITHGTSLSYNEDITECIIIEIETTSLSKKNFTIRPNANRIKTINKVYKYLESFKDLD